MFLKFQNRTTSSLGESSATSSTEATNSAQKFDWSESLQGLLLGAYYYGYLTANVNAGQVAQWIGPKRLLTLSMLASGLLSFMGVWCAKTSIYLLVVNRIVTGLAQVSY